MNEGEMVGACSTYGGEKKYLYWVLVEKLKETDHLDVQVYGRMML
jgi:hypothetical protein